VSAESPAAYLAPAECPSRATWLDALRARLPGLLRTHPLVESFEVQIDREPIEWPLGSTSTTACPRSRAST